MIMGAACGRAHEPTGGLEYAYFHSPCRHPILRWRRSPCQSPVPRHPTEAHVKGFHCAAHDVGHVLGGDEPGQTVYPVTAGPLVLHAIVGAAPEGKALKQGLEGLRKLKKGRPPLFGLMHYERCRLVFQPLTTFGK